MFWFTNIVKISHILPSRSSNIRFNFSLKFELEFTCHTITTPNVPLNGFVTIPLCVDRTIVYHHRPVLHTIVVPSYSAPLMVVTPPPARKILLWLLYQIPHHLCSRLIARHSILLFTIPFFYTSVPRVRINMNLVWLLKVGRLGKFGISWRLFLLGYNILPTSKICQHNNII